MGSLKRHQRKIETGAKKRKTHHHNHKKISLDLSSKRRNGEFCCSTLASLRRQAKNTQKRHTSLKKNPKSSETPKRSATPEKRQARYSFKKSLLNPNNQIFTPNTQSLRKTLTVPDKHRKHLFGTVTIRLIDIHPKTFGKLSQACQSPTTKLTKPIANSPETRPIQLSPYLPQTHIHMKMKIQRTADHLCIKMFMGHNKRGWRTHRPPTFFT